MTHTSNSADMVSEFGRMVEFRSTPNVWSTEHDVFQARHRDMTLCSLINVAVSDSPQGLTLVLTPC